jgi:hypothetical protein
MEEMSGKSVRLSVRSAAVAETAGLFSRRMSFPTSNQFTQLGGDAAVEFQIRPEFDPHGNVPMFGADADESNQFRVEIHHDFYLFPARYPLLR